MSEIFYIEVEDFYAAVEQAADPGLRGRPVIVGGDPRKRGQVQSASREARSAGVETGMRVDQALALCAEARAVRTDMGSYRDVDERLRACVWRRVRELEAVALGAYFFDCRALLSSAARQSRVEDVARQLSGAVRDETGLALRVGIGSSKYIAKLAAAEAASEGIGCVLAGDELAFLSPLPVSRLPGVGPKTVKTLAELLGVHSVADLASESQARVEAACGNHGLRILQLARGHDDTPLRASPHPQSIGQEVSLEVPQRDLDALGEHLRELSRGLARKLERQGLVAGCVGVKVYFDDETSESRTRTLGQSIGSGDSIYSTAAKLLDRTHAGTRAVRRVGMSVSKLTLQDATGRQLELFSGAS